MKSKIIIVDEKDKVIGFKDREAVQQEDIYRVSALWITNSRGDILLARRALTKFHDPGKWGTAVAGTVEQGENYEINIHKEAEEEIGLKNIAPKPGSKLRTSGEHNYFTQWYYYETDKLAKEFIVKKDEVDDIKWFSCEEIKHGLLKNPDKFLKGAKRWIEIFC